MDKTFYVYIGVTSDLIKRIWEHREGVADAFTKKYGVKQLVWFEIHADAISAITREKQLKKWNRAWKVELIQSGNPLWADLYEGLTGRTQYGFPPSRERRVSG